MSNYELFEFQKEVVKRFKDTPGVLIGDDMGLGKTIEAIDLDWQRRQQAQGQKTLVITPLSVVTDAWEDGYAKFLPELRVVALDPKARASFVKAVEDGSADVYVMHWDALRLMPELAKVHWFHIIGDEIHRIKNRKSQVTRALKRLKADYKTGLSGTPADNKPNDLWSILNWLYPKNYTSYWRFFKTFCTYEQVENRNGPIKGAYKVLGVQNEKLLHKEMSHYYIRRRKEEVLKDLPNKYYNTLWVDLSPTQRRAYNAMKKDMLAWVGDQQDKPLAVPSVITQLLRLQQFAVGSIEIEPYKKRQRNLQFDPEQPECEENSRFLIIDALRYKIVDPSTKLDAGMQLLEDSDEPIVFFSHFRTLVDLFTKRLADQGISYGTVVGGMSKDERGQVVRDFQAGKTRVVIGTIAAGGVGITLTRSSHVVFFDRAWSPSINRQAEDRLHRIGQKNAVQVTDIMAKNTIDLGRVQQIQAKWTWIQKLLGDKTFDYQKTAQNEEALLKAVEGIL